MEIVVVIIVVVAAAVFTALKLKRILRGKESNCTCADCPFAKDSQECAGHKENCSYSGIGQSKELNTRKNQQKTD
jgi:hypothetical protein